MVVAVVVVVFFDVNFGMRHMGSLVATGAGCTTALRADAMAPKTAHSKSVNLLIVTESSTVSTPRNGATSTAEGLTSSGTVTRPSEPKRSRRGAYGRL